GTPCPGPGATPPAPWASNGPNGQTGGNPLPPRSMASAPHSPPRLFDRSLRRKRLDRAARTFANADFLQRRAAQDVAERLAPILKTFPLAVDLSAHKGAFREALAAEAPGKVETLIEADLSSRMLAGRDGPRLVADDERLPFADASVDLIVSCLGLH